MRSVIFCSAPRKPLWISWYERVVGDINFTMACSLTAKKLNFKAAHVEAGLLSRDMNLPGEINRLLTDAIAELLIVLEPSGGGKPSPRAD